MIFCFHVVVEPNKPAWRAIIGQFGVDILLDDGHIDRAKLGQIIFNDESKRHTLNRITHPFIQREMLLQLIKEFYEGYSAANYVVL